MSPAPKISPEFLDLRALSIYTSISIRSWRDYLRRCDAPAIIKLPGKILVAKADVDKWLAKFRQTPGRHLGNLVDEIVEKHAGGHR